MTCQPPCVPYPASPATHPAFHHQQSACKYLKAVTGKVRAGTMPTRRCSRKRYVDYAWCEVEEHPIIAAALAVLISIGVWKAASRPGSSQTAATAPEPARTRPEIRQRKAVASLAQMDPRIVHLEKFYNELGVRWAVLDAPIETYRAQGLPMDKVQSQNGTTFFPKDAPWLDFLRKTLDAHEYAEVIRAREATQW